MLGPTLSNHRMPQQLTILHIEANKQRVEPTSGYPNIQSSASLLSMASSSSSATDLLSPVPKQDKVLQQPLVDQMLPTKRSQLSCLGHLFDKSKKLARSTCQRGFLPLGWIAGGRWQHSGRGLLYLSPKQAKYLRSSEQLTVI